MEFCIGDTVEALWPPDGRWYAATVIEQNAGTLIVKFLEDDYVRSLKPHQVHISVETLLQ